MMRRTILAGAFALGLAGPATAQQQPVEIQFWHGLTQPLGGMLEQIAADFNASQNQYRVVASFRGSYPETMVAAIAAFRAGQAPHIVQMFEVGTGTMMAAGRAVKPVHELLAETGVQIPFDDYLPAVRGYYSLRDGRMMSMPFNSSTAVVFYNKDAFRRAGLDPEAFPQTWQALEQAARRLKAAGVECPMTMAWPTWTQVEQFSAIHNIPLATQGNGFGGLNAELRINNPLMVRHLQNLVDWQREGLFRYGGRDGQGDALFPNGTCAIIFGSSGLRARIQREAQFPWGVAMLPYYDGVAGAPINSIIGGASFWAMNRGPNATRSAEENRGIAQFFAWLARPEVVRKWHVETGFLPVRVSVFRALEAEGFYRQNPGADIPINQLLRGGGQMTENSMGIRLGGFVEIRTIIQEEMERAFQGQQNAQQALDNAVQRGNVVLRNFERQNRQ
ncbi:sn-glycerol-3-phosphate ABC transporter substrate-binding protein UgpB [Roseomonas alkaliterrae]|uniref:sn-glycerol-3-phosphate-binding periplasmic protein UgpB n=2 Tax=Neoroseomonas alkaliterrae TaxID=1452450 RepID=A0A840Y480_9PROT|nr:sn-glycerol-3-phosphate ABC transporter substrate-binding protein UgpB [Neoroseomonas alkaliterrae]MBB5688694.1 sn-glycerol 3-phosphate transport system substrate-binding protein [Neoroseomonas alkaliterrae]MBR0675231.1 sn-glycerol-3-phosphate ABC transporter substrate-binding protein UgpB [Neoroseomonas alkaliterrae]